MLREAGEFASYLKRCEKDIRTLKQTTEGASAYQSSSAAVVCPVVHPQVLHHIRWSLQGC